MHVLAVRVFVSLPVEISCLTNIKSSVDYINTQQDVMNTFPLKLIYYMDFERAIINK